MTPRLILADQHPLEPFLVRSQQFLCRAAAFAKTWPGPVQLWIPAPALPKGSWLSRAALSDSSLEIKFGPRIEWRLPGATIHAKALHRLWLRRHVRLLGRSGEKSLFYFRTLRHVKAVLDLLVEYRIPYAFEPHEVFFRSARKPKEIRQIEEEVLTGAKILFPITSPLSSSLQSEFRLSTSMVVSPLAHNGANLSLPIYDPAAPPRFLYVGSLHRWKGLETAFEATKGLGVDFDVVGDGGGLARTKVLCRERGYSHVRLHGSVSPDKVSQFYEPGSLCLLPLSNGEIARSFTSPLKLFEYMAAGRPIVAGDLPTTREIVKDGEHARLLPVGDVAQWRNTISDLLANRKEALRLAENARRLAGDCTWVERAKPLVKHMLPLAGNGTELTVDSKPAETQILQNP